MVQVIPTINCMDFGCVAHKFLQLSSFLPREAWVHIDVADAKFTFNKTWSHPSELAKLLKAHAEFNFNIEVHLMIEEPEREVLEWLKIGSKRVIVHGETIWDNKFRKTKVNPEIVIKDIFKKSGEFGAEVMLATNPETRLEDFKDYLDEFNAFQVLSVRPGLSGQKFLTVALEKIRFLRAQFPNAKIEVDGGVNFETGKLAREAGADILAAGSYIFESGDPKGAFEKLEEL